MAAKVFVIFAAALFAQSVSAACLGNNYDLGNARSGSIYGCNNLGGYSSSNGQNLGYGSNVAVTSGGGFPIVFASPISPSGISIYSENSIDGLLDVCGALPVLSAVAFDATLPTSGSAGVQYGCGNGQVGITSADGASGLSGAGYSGSGLSGAGYSSGLSGAGYGRGCGCGCRN